MKFLKAKKKIQNGYKTQNQNSPAKAKFETPTTVLSQPKHEEYKNFSGVVV